jgi:hypothetical protein
VVVDVVETADGEAMGAKTAVDEAVGVGGAVFEAVLLVVVAAPWVSGGRSSRP